MSHAFVLRLGCHGPSTCESLFAGYSQETLETKRSFISNWKW